MRRIDDVLAKIQWGFHNVGLMKFGNMMQDFRKAFTMKEE